MTFFYLLKDNFTTKYGTQVHFTMEAKTAYLGTKMFINFSFKSLKMSPVRSHSLGAKKGDQSGLRLTGQMGPKQRGSQEHHM